MFTNKVYWFENDPNPVQTAPKPEVEAHGYAKDRSLGISKCEVLRGDRVVASYVNGIDTMAPVAEPVAELAAV